MVWTKLPRSLVHRAVKTAESNAAFRDRWHRAQHAEVLRAQKRAEQAQLDLLAARADQRRAFLDACIALDRLEDARALLEAGPREDAS